MIELATDESGLADRLLQEAQDHRVYSRHGRGSRLALLQLEEAWERHGRSVYALACTLLGDREAAAKAVTLGITDLARSDHRGSASDIRRCMARHVYWRTQELTALEPTAFHLPPAMAGLSRLAQLQRACLALCVFGGHTYREAAAVLGVPPATVAELLTAGLREMGRFPPKLHAPVLTRPRDAGAHIGGAIAEPGFHDGACAQRVPTPSQHQHSVDRVQPGSEPGSGRQRLLPCGEDGLPTPGTLTP